MEIVRGRLIRVSLAVALEEAGAAEETATRVGHELAVDEGTTAPKADKATRVVKDTRVFNGFPVVDDLLTERTLCADLAKEHGVVLVAIRLALL